MKKVLIFSLAYYPTHVGGAEVAIKEITDRIPDVEFHMVTQRFGADASREERVGAIRVHRVGNGSSYLQKMLFVPRAALLALRLHRAHRFDAAWAMMSYMSLPLVLMRFSGASIPYALTLQEGDPFRHVFRRLHILPVLPLLRAGFRQATVIQTISTFLAGWARSIGYAGKIEVIPNGADVAHFAQEYPAALVNEAKDRLDKRMGEIFLITTSRLVHKNGIDDVIRALPDLADNVRFLVLGTGPDEAGLRSLTRELGLDERVSFLGHIDHEEMPKYLKASDIFIRPSRSEGMGNSFIEAMAAGLPVIATQEGGIADFLFDEERNPESPVTGWAVDKDSPSQIVKAVQAIIAKPEKVRAVVATARAMVVEKYDWDLIARGMRERIFGPILGESTVAQTRG